jgi:hypothetical protein
MLAVLAQAMSATNKLVFDGVLRISLEKNFSFYINSSLTKLQNTLYKKSTSEIEVRMC